MDDERDSGTKLRLGLVGAGDVVRRFYLPALREHPQFLLCAIASPQGGSARVVAAEHAIPIVCDSAEALIARDDIDAVVICTPPFAHRALAMSALRSGKHVLIEKPVTARFADCAALLGLAERVRPILYYTFNNRLRDENQHLTEQVLGGALGPLDCIDVEWLRTKSVAASGWWRDPAQAGGGVLADLGSHLLMIALGLVPVRHRFAARCAVMRRCGGAADTEDFAVAHVVIDDHLPLVLKTGWGMALDRPALVNLRAFGRKGMATNLDYAGPKTDGYRAVLDRFASHIRAGRQPDLGIVADSMRLLHALLAAARTGRLVTGRFRGGGWS